MTQGFVPVVRQSPPAVATAEIIVAAPPALPRSASPSLLVRLLPLGMSIATVGVMAVIFISGSAVTRNPAFLAFPMMMLVSMVLTAVTQRGHRRGSEIDGDRVEYLQYLSHLRGTVTETAAAQRAFLSWNHPDPDALWTLVGGPRMWEREVTDRDFCLVRVGVGIQPLSPPLVAPEFQAGEHSDPITVAAARRFIRTHATITDVPITIDLTARESVTIDGDSAEVRGLLRAMICQLAVLQPPDQLLIVGVIAGRNQAHWDWLKWLPHNQHPAASDSLGSARMVYQSMAEARSALADTGLPPRVVVVGDLEEGCDFDS